MEQMTLEMFGVKTTIMTDRQTDRQTRQLCVVELFSGLECISDAFRKRGHKCYTVDWDTRFKSCLHKDISTMTIEDIPQEFRNPDVVFVGMDCTTYSVAAIGHHRKKDDQTGYLLPKTEKAQFADNMAVHVKEIIKALSPTVQIWENPVGGLRKMSFMQDIEFRNTTTYCQYGFTYRKATDFFSNVDLHLRPPCKNGDPCHEKAPRGARTGLQRITDPVLKSVYPPELCDHIVKRCEEIAGQSDF